MNNFENRNAVVTGASAGIGYSIVNALLEAGVRVVGNARRAQRLDDMTTGAEKRYGERRFVGVTGDINKEETLVKLMAASQAAFGETPDIFVVNAGRGLPGSLLQSDQSLWASLFELNCLSAMAQMKSAAQVMVERAKRRAGQPLAQDIIILGSIVGRHLSPVNPIYGATKYAVNSLAEALRREVCEHWVRVTLIEPGTVKSEFQEVAGYDAQAFAAYEQQSGPFVTGDDVANFLMFAVSQPPHVHFNNVVIRPTRQVYP